uniref:Deoxycytidylate deaminase n=1 Tax=Maylandia zebra TaxID=106582 RepID=A0A3P9DTI7_9CICH
MSVVFLLLCNRTDFLVDTDYFMAVAVLSAQRSKDPNTQVGACLVNQDNKIVGTGHNCMPNDCEGKLPWNREGAKLDTKYIYVCHAELNAIVNASANADVKGCTMYVTLFPCNECAKLIIQAGLKEVVYLCDKYHSPQKIETTLALPVKCCGVFSPVQFIVNVNSKVFIVFHNVNTDPWIETGVKCFLVFLKSTISSLVFATLSCR